MLHAKFAVALDGKASYSFTMKKCPRCSTVKNPSEFYKSKADKLSAYCKPCMRAYDAEWVSSNRARKYRSNRAWVVANGDRRRHMLKASNAVWSAIQKGQLVRGTICEHCGLDKPTEAAHTDYSQLLSVTWLCTKCHRTWDAQSPKTKPSDPS